MATVEEIKTRVLAGTITNEDIQLARQIEIEDPAAFSANTWLRALAGASEADEWLVKFLQEEINYE